MVRIGRERLRQLLHLQGTTFERTAPGRSPLTRDKEAKLDRIEEVTSSSRTDASPSTNSDRCRSGPAAGRSSHPTLRAEPLGSRIADLSVTTHSRPKFSNDNPYSERWFKTLNTIGPFPTGSARWRMPAASAPGSSPGHTERFHAAGLLTPPSSTPSAPTGQRDTRHGPGRRLLAAPERFVHKPCVLPARPAAAWISKSSTQRSRLSDSSLTCLTELDRLRHAPLLELVSLHLGVSAAAGDYQEVLVDPGDLRAGQPGEERRDGRTQFVRRVEGESRVVVCLGLSLEPLRGARALMAEGVGIDQLEPVRPLHGVLERRHAVEALLVLGEAREVAAPDRPRVLLRRAGVDEELAVRLQHPGRPGSGQGRSGGRS